VRARRESSPVARAKRISNRNGKRVRKARRRYLSALDVPSKAVKPRS
jgi:hypothetical protein